MGALPDMVTFTPDGKTLLVANDGEPNDAYTIDQEGSVSIVDVHNITNRSPARLRFAKYNGMETQRRASGIASSPNATAQDFEPEYIAVGDDGPSGTVAIVQILLQ